MIELPTFLTQLVAITDSLKNIFWIILFVWGIRKILTSVNNLIKTFPHFLEEYERTRLHIKTIERATGR